MADLLAAFFFGTFISWVTLLVVLPIAQKLADFGLPGWRDLLWQVAILAAATNLVYVALMPIHFALAWLSSLVVFWVLMVKWFRVDLFGAVVIMVVHFVLRLFFGIFLGALLNVH